MYLCMQVPVPSESRGTRDLELKLQAVVSCLAFMLGTELGSSRRVVCAPSCWAISPNPLKVIRKQIELHLVWVEEMLHFKKMGYVLKNISNVRDCHSKAV